MLSKSKESVLMINLPAENLNIPALFSPPPFGKQNVTGEGATLAFESVSAFYFIIKVYRRSGILEFECFGDSHFCGFLSLI